MKDLLPFIVAGIAFGAIYGLAATGLVLTYKTSGIFNFGHGALATAAAYVFFWMHGDKKLGGHGWDWKISAFVAILIVGPLLGLLMERISRALSRQRTAWKVVGTAGLILVVQGLGTVKYGGDTIKVDQFLPSANEVVIIADVRIRYVQIIVTVFALVVVGLLYALFRFTRLGIAMRAVVDDPDLVDLQGISPTKVRRLSWIIGSTLAAASGVLILPFLGLNGVTLTLLVVNTFGAVAFGMFSSIPLTFLGGLIVGVGESVLQKAEIAKPALTGISKSWGFILLILIMLLTPKRKLAAPTAATARPSLEWHGPITLRLGAGAIVFGLLASVPLWGGIDITPYWTPALVVAILMLSLGLLVRTAGIVSLCTAAFAAIGAVAFAQFHGQQDIPWVIALLLAGLVAVPVGALVAIPSIRLSGLFLALATLGFGLLIERLFYRQSYMFTVLAEGRRVPRPGWAKTDSQYYMLVLGVVLLFVLLIAAINRGRLGRMLQGMGESPTAVGTLGLSINVTRVIVFCVGAFMAAVAGGLYGGINQNIGADSMFFSSFQSLILVAVLALAPFRVPWYAIFAGVTQVIPAYIEGKHTTHWLTFIFGFFAIVTAMQGGPHPMPLKLQKFFEAKFGRSKATSHVGEHAAESHADLRRPVPTTSGDGVAGLTVTDLTVRFGGLIAVDHVTLAAPMGRITGLIGPNGAGKTTTFNACSGLNRPTTGNIRFHGHDVSHQSPGSRARHGLGRTFQIMELCESLTVADNVALGRESSQAGAKIFTQLVAPPNDVRVRDLATVEALHLCGISELAGMQAGALSTGQRRLVELARCLAGPFDILLLDEPSSGLDREETERFGALLQRVVAERGCGILLVEHDMALVMDICDHLYVLDFGRLIFEGSPQEAASSPVVQAAYLGTETVEALAGSNEAGA
ncbi:MAG: ATP-binding cassette domain-containing protein [Actinomycetota bacterium]|nr:ATP-binding cassette domain-containing protein [Actinomycetota bacterium]